MSEAVDESNPKRVHWRTYPTNKSRLISVHEVSHRTGEGVSTIWKKVAANEFVQPIRIRKGVTRWLESSIDDWISEQVEKAK